MESGARAASGGWRGLKCHTYTNDILGNRTGDDWGSGNRVHEWDCLNRLTLRGGTGWSNTYVYRADGMRVRENGNNTSYTGPYLWRYDGQMPIEQDYGPSGGLTVTRNGFGARGIDFVEELTNTTTTVSFPIYDAHGNTVAHLQRNGTGYTVGGRRSYDVWGRVRSGGNSGGSRSRYSGNIGHIQDEGSQYIYMRARYYDPVVGRFISEDPARDSANLFTYADNDPIGNIDVTGKVAICLVSLLVIFVEALISAAIDIGIQNIQMSAGLRAGLDWQEVGVAFAVGLIGGLIGHFARAAYYAGKSGTLAMRAWKAGGGSFSTYFLKCLGVGAGNTAGRGEFAAIFRAMLSSGMGSIAMQIYGLYLQGLMEEE